MPNLTEKELSSLNDALSEEELLTKKFQMLSEQSTDREMKNTFEEISRKHQGHYNLLFDQLK